MAVKKTTVPDKIKTGPKTNKMKDKDKTERIFRHLAIPKNIYRDMEDENMIEKRAKDEKISTEETLISLISEGIMQRKRIRMSISTAEKA